MAPDQPRWHSVHAHHHRENLDHLVLGGVRPLVAALSGVVDAVAYQRHWRQGPHVRINVRTDERTMTDTVMPTAQRILGEYLSTAPSEGTLDPQRERALHRRLAFLERDTGPTWPWYPDNSVHRAEFEDRADVLGGRAVADIVDDFHAASTAVALAMTELPRGARRTMAAFDLLVATAHGMSGTGIARGFLSLRSHAEGFLCGYPEGAGLRPAWDEHYRGHAALLEKRVAAVVEAIDTGTTGAPFAGAWLTLLAPLRDRAAGLLAAGHRLMPVGGSDPGVDVVDVSPFHRTLFDNPEWLRLRESADFVLYRLMVNLTYLHLTKLGITPAQRLLLCHLIANAVERSHGVSALDLVGSQP